MKDEKFKDEKGGLRNDIGEGSKFHTEKEISDSNYKKRPDLEKKHEPVDNAEMAGD